MKREKERKEQESKKNQKVKFLSGGSQLGAVLASPKSACLLLLWLLLACPLLQLQLITSFYATKMARDKREGDPAKRAILCMAGKGPPCLH